MNVYVYNNKNTGLIEMVYDLDETGAFIQLIHRINEMNTRSGASLTTDDYILEDTFAKED